MLHIIALASLKLSFQWNVRAYLCIMVQNICIYEYIKMRNTIQICYCYFNLQSSSARTVHTVTATLCTDFYSISFRSYIPIFFSSSLSLRVYVCVYIKQADMRKKEPKIFILTLTYRLNCKIDATVGSLYAPPYARWDFKSLHHTFFLSFFSTRNRLIASIKYCTHRLLPPLFYIFHANKSKDWFENLLKSNKFIIEKKYSLCRTDEQGKMAETWRYSAINKRINCIENSFFF